MIEEKNINRDEIYVGEVVFIETTDRYPLNYEPKHKFDTARADQRYISEWHTYRSMLFTLDEQRLATDLLYDSPNYPIFNISSELKCSGADVAIKDAYNLGPLLQYFNYSKDLNLEDIKKIREIFFTGRFGYDNCELFGATEFIPNKFKDYKNIIDPNQRYNLYKAKLYLEFLKKLENVSDNVLPVELMYILDQRGYSQEFLGFKPDPFKPSILEGPVKKLTILK